MLHLRLHHRAQPVQSVRVVPRDRGHRVHNPPRPGGGRPRLAPVPAVPQIRPDGGRQALRPPRGGGTGDDGRAAKTHPRAG